MYSLREITIQQMNMVQKKTSRNVSSFFQPLIGQKPSRARIGWGSFLTFDFGHLHTEDGHQHGDWHLWIYQCDWVLSENGNVRVNSEKRRTLIERWIRTLEKVPLTNVSGSGGHWNFEFGSRLHLKCEPPSDEEGDPDSHYWMLFMPDRRVLAVGPGSRVEIEGVKKLAHAVAAGRE